MATTPYSPAVVERAMKIQEVMLRAMSGELTWLQAADILGMRPRSLLRWRRRYEEHGYEGLFDRRRRTPSPKRAPLHEVEEVVRLYRETYGGYNVQHFHEVARKKHRVRLSYTFVKKALQEAGLVAKRRARGRHRRRREPRACLGEMIHLDGSLHAWLALRPESKQVLIQVVDDATSRLLYAQLEPAESTEAVMRALRSVFEAYGLPAALYTDRAGWAFHTPEAGGKVDRERLTQVGRGLAHLGVEHIPSYSPQARGRSERANRTLQDRLVNELRVAGVRSVEAANRYLREEFVPAYCERFGREPADPTSAFVAVGTVDLDQVLCHEEERTVALDNTVVLDRVRLQIAKQPGLRTCARRRVTVRRHLDGTHTVLLGRRVLGRYDRRGRSLDRLSTASDPTPEALNLDRRTTSRAA